MNSQSKTGLWIFGAVILAIIVGAAAYFMLISPELDQAAAARDETDIAREANDLTQLEIDKMKVLEQEVPDWRIEVAKVSLDLPPRPEQPALERLIAARLEASDLPLVDMTTGRPEAIDPLLAAGSEPPTISEPQADPNAPAEPAVAPEATTEGEDEETSTDGTTGGVAGDTAAAPVVAEAPFVGLLALPVTITTEGDPSKVLDFLKAMENQKTRFFTVTGYSISKATASEETPGRPELSEEQWTVQITGMVFSLLDDNRSFVLDEDGELKEYKVGSNVDNAFIPLPGTEDDAT